jgi:predicted nucleic acid-binding protein
MDRPTARRILEEAEAKLHGKEQAADSEEIIDLAIKSGCSAYDCEYVALARKLGVRLVTKDARILKDFPREAVDLEKFAKG